MIDAVGIYEKLTAVNFFDNPRYRNRYDDISISDFFHLCFGNDLRFNNTTNEWFMYDTTLGIWKAGADAIVQSKCKILARSVLQYAEDVQREFSSSDESGDEAKQKRVKKFLSWARALQNFSARQRLERDARPIGSFTTPELDADKNLFNCVDGVINLAEGPNQYELLPHSPNYLMTRCSNVIAHGEQNGDRWERFLDEVMQGDDEKKDYLQRVLGNCLVYGNKSQEVYMIWGQSTRNGKTSTLEAVAHAMGDYATTANPATFGMSSKTTDPQKPRSDVANLAGARFIRCPEPQKGMILDASLLKLFSGANEVVTRQLFGKEFSFKSEATIIFDVNSLPRVTDSTLFDSGRISVIPFSRHFSEEEQDVNLSEILQSQESANYIFWWLAEGLEKSKKNPLKNRPDSVVQATKAYSESNDKVGLFLKDVLKKDNNAEPITVKDLYDLFQDWCREAGMVPYRKSRFIDELKSRQYYSQTGTVRGKTKRNVIKGYCLSEEGQELANQYIH